MKILHACNMAVAQGRQKLLGSDYRSGRLSPLRCYPYPATFGRVWAAYGGIFIVMSMLWGWQVDKIAPDKFDLIGGLIALLGVLVIMF